jgi:DeoR family transcriptional regulator, fructose operon transcriptional repressor
VRIITQSHIQGNLQGNLRGNLEGNPSRSSSEDRLRWLGERLDADGAVGIATAADALGVSEMTIRRDLDELEERGTARRVRGGARALGPQTFAERHSVAARAKSRIAAKLAELVPAEGFVAFDASTTVMRLATGLGAVRDLTVLTNGPDTFGALQGLAGVTPLLTGGRLDDRTGSLVGPLACRAAAQLAVATFFASAAGLDPGSGATEATLDEAEVKRTIATGAAEVIVAVDASKLGGRAPAIGLEWDRIDLLVTDLDPSDGRLAPYRGLTRLL